jgi:hypothetical protein
MPNFFSGFLGKSHLEGYGRSEFQEFFSFQDLSRLSGDPNLSNSEIPTEPSKAPLKFKPRRLGPWQRRRDLFEFPAERQSYTKPWLKSRPNFWF